MVFSIRHSSRQEQKIPILLTYLGYQHPLELTNYPQGANFYQIYYCIQGKAEFVMDGQRSVLQPGQMFFTWPQVGFSCKALTDDCSVHLLGFTGKGCEGILRTCGMEESGVHQVSDEALIPKYLEQLLYCQQQKAGQDTYSKLCYALLVDLSSRLRKLSEAQPAVPDNETVQRVVAYLETNYASFISLDMLADELHLTKEYLCILFKKEMHHTILHYLTLIRIGWARLYLEQYPDKKVYEIGKMCGFDTPSYFGKKFKQIVGMTPERYRHVNSITLNQ